MVLHRQCAKVKNKNHSLQTSKFSFSTELFEVPDFFFSICRITWSLLSSFWLISNLLRSYALFRYLSVLN